MTTRPFTSVAMLSMPFGALKRLITNTPFTLLDLGSNALNALRGTETLANGYPPILDICSNALNALRGTETQMGQAMGWMADTFR